MGLYNEIRLLQHRDTLESIAAGRGLDCWPIHVRIEPIENCNFRCHFCCWYGDAEIRPPNVDLKTNRKIPLDRFLRLTDELIDGGTRAFSFTGAGDPLVYIDLDQVMNRIVERGAVFGISSNLAMKINDSTARALAGASWVRWSMNGGTEEIYLRTNNPRGSNGHEVFVRVQDNVRRIDALRRARAPRPDFNASFVVSTKNHEDVYAAAVLARDLGLDSINFRPDTPMIRSEAPLGYGPDVEQQIVRAQKELEGESFRVHVNEDRLEDVRKLGDPRLVCFYANHTTYIAANGDVYPCCYTRYDKTYSMGSILDRPFRAFWEDPKRREYYKRLVFDACPSCPYGKTNQVLRDLYEGKAKPDDYARPGGGKPDPFV